MVTCLHRDSTTGAFDCDEPVQQGNLCAAHNVPAQPQERAVPDPLCACGKILDHVGQCAPRESERAAEPEWGDTPEFLRTLAGSSEEAGRHDLAALYRIGAALVAALDRQTEAMNEGRKLQRTTWVKP